MVSRHSDKKMMAARNPATRASNIYRERYTKELKTSSHWEGTWGLVDPSILSPSRSPRRSPAPQPHLSPAHTTEFPLPPLGGKSGASGTSSAPGTTPTLSPSPADTLRSSALLSGSIQRAPATPHSPVRTSRRNYRHLTGEERTQFYASYIAKPQASEFTAAVTASFASFLPKV